MISQFLVYIESGLGSLFPCPYLLGALTPFEEKEEQQREGEHILHPFSHPHAYTHLSFASLHCHAHPRAGILILLVPSLYFYYPQIAGA